MDNGILLYLLILLVGALSSFVQRVSGFGSGIVVMMFMPHFMPVHISTLPDRVKQCLTDTRATAGIGLPTGGNGIKRSRFLMNTTNKNSLHIFASPFCSLVH